MRSLGDMQIKTFIIPGYKKPKIWTTSTQAYKKRHKNKKIFYKIYTCDTICICFDVPVYAKAKCKMKKHSFIGGEKNKYLTIIHADIYI